MSYPAVLSPVERDVRDERARQDARWGEQNHRDGTGPRTALAVGLVHAPEASRAARLACQAAARAGTLTWHRILLEEVFEAIAEDEPAALRAELIQVAAVAVAWVEAIDRRTNTRTAEAAPGPGVAS